MSKDRVIVNDGLLRLWKEMVMVCFKVLSQHFPGRMEKNTDKRQSH